MALRRASGPNGAQNRDDTPSPTPPPRAHQHVAQRPQPRAPSSEVDQNLRVSPSQAVVPNLIELRAASNLLHLHAALALQGDRQPLRATQPGNRAQV